MKIGLIVESGPEGADSKILTFLATKLTPGANLRIDVATMGDKKALCRACGDVAERMLRADGCDRVLIVWDLYPAWRPHGAPPCRHEDKVEILASLKAANVSPAEVALVCIEEELEAWLIADERALRALFAEMRRPHRVGRVARTGTPDTKPKPKTALSRLFQQHVGRRYVDREHALRIAEKWTNWDRLEHSASFQRFRFKLTGN